MKLIDWPLLFVAENLADGLDARRFRVLIAELERRGMSFRELHDPTQLLETCWTRRNIVGAVVDWCSGDIAEKERQILALKAKFPELPVYLMTENAAAEDLSTALLSVIDGYLYLDEDSIPFMAGRIEDATRKYVERLYPPFFKELMEYVEDYKYPWHTPGHMGGEGFLKSPTGVAFYRFFGENMMRSDISVSVPELGSLLDHSGVLRVSEDNAAKTFRADRTYYVLNGTSTSNQIVWKSQVTAGDFALVDRNCHKSIHYAMINTGAVPVYMKPRRNAWGIIGPVRLEEFSRRAGLEKLAAAGRKPKDDEFFTMSVLTNSTYDGLCYNIALIHNELREHVRYLHFDEAWFAYAAFHPLYQRFYGMTDEVEVESYPPVFVTQSTHKLLTAFSQASMIHIKNGSEEAIIDDEFNEAFMMYSSTSPNYPMIASLDVATGMMKADGLQMSEDNIREAIALRCRMRAIERELEEKGGWFFSMWQPQFVEQKGESVDFADADADLLMEDQQAWILKSGESWHGFTDIEEDFILLDPIKLTFLTPGLTAEGKYEPRGIPAAIVTDYLMEKGVVVEKTDTYSFLILHSFGTTGGKHGELLTSLFAFKADYDKNTPLELAIPRLAVKNSRYQGMGLRDLCDVMHRFYCVNNFLAVMDEAFASLPPQAMIPAEASACVVRKEVEYVRLQNLAGRIPAVMVVPYPPGIPVLMGGERLTEDNLAVLRYLQLLEILENRFPGYAREIHGVESDEVRGRILYRLLCVVEEPVEGGEKISSGEEKL